MSSSKSYSHFFSKIFKHICLSLDVNFNESLTNDVVSFEQLGPDIFLISPFKHYVVSTHLKHLIKALLLSMKLVLLINLKLLTTANSFLLNIAEHENYSANKYENASCCWHFHIY